MAAPGGCTPPPEEDREAFLRAHGVTIETPQDREAAAAAAAQLAGLRVGDAGTASFTYVRIPADSTQPFEECHGVVPAVALGARDALPALLSPRFASGEVDQAALRSTGLMQLGGGAVLDRLTPAAVARQGGMAERFRLGDSVFLYLDEVGALKHLPPNRRASELAAQCGYGQGIAFHGDTFVGRVEGDRNLDFGLAELGPSAPWVQGAAQQNLERQAAEGGRSTGISAEELAHRGGEGDGYTWRQDEEDVEVSVPVVAGTISKQIKVVFKAMALRVALPDCSLDLHLYARVAPDECTWSLADGVLVLTLTKAVPDESWPVLTPEA